MTCGSDGNRDGNYLPKILRLEIFTRDPQVEFHTYIRIHQFFFRYVSGIHWVYHNIYKNNNK
jgi:hypothetical protein